MKNQVDRPCFDDERSMCLEASGRRHVLLENIGRCDEGPWPSRNTRASSLALFAEIRLLCTSFARRSHGSSYSMAGRGSIVLYRESYLICCMEVEAWLDVWAALRRLSKPRRAARKSHGSSYVPDWSTSAVLLWTMSAVPPSLLSVVPSPFNSETELLEDSEMCLGDSLSSEPGPSLLSDVTLSVSDDDKAVGSTSFWLASTAEWERKRNGASAYGSSYFGVAAVSSGHSLSARSDSDKHHTTTVNHVR